MYKVQVLIEHALCMQNLCVNSFPGEDSDDICRGGGGGGGFGAMMILWGVMTFQQFLLLLLHSSKMSCFLCSSHVRYFGSKSTNQSIAGK